MHAKVGVGVFEWRDMQRRIASFFYNYVAVVSEN